MADHRPFVPYPAPVLRAVADPVDGVTDQVRAIWDEMLRAMYAMPGVGLAAPQLGIGQRLAVLDCSDSRDQAIRLANPEILWSSDATNTFDEASPNLPGASASIERPAEVEVRFLDEAGAEQVRKFEGLWATSVQHQIDHLNGRMFFDNLSSLKRQRLLQAQKKRAKKAARG
ncbi:MAG: peptide deformylase [Pseudomonadota bacterium]